MIRKIRTDQVRVGMYISQLDREWIEHSFFSSRFAVRDTPVIARLAAEGITHVFIDTTKGLDVEPEHPAPVDLPSCALQTPAARVTASEERSRAQAICGDAARLVKDIMGHVRLGQQIDLGVVEPLTEKMISSLLRNPHALSSVVRIRSKDEYTFMHSVGVAAIMTAFARHLGLAEDDIHEIAVGALLHDLGKVLIPDAVLNKPGRLTEEEWVVMRSHAARGVEVLSETVGFSDKSMEAVAMHHERNDGSGYPLGLKGEQITLIGQMSAIVDVYDALTSHRPYKTPWEPSLALKKMLEWSPTQFDAGLVQRFIRFLGIYPVGTLVELESGLLGIVMEQGPDLLRPQVLVVYNGKRGHYVNPHTLDLDRRGDERIICVASASEHGINVRDFI